MDQCFLLGSDANRLKNNNENPCIQLKRLRIVVTIYCLGGVSSLCPLYVIITEICTIDYLEILNKVMLTYTSEEMPLICVFVHDNHCKNSLKVMST